MEKKDCIKDRKRSFIHKPEKGFTMVELIVVLVILAIIAAVAVPALIGYIDSSREKHYYTDAEAALTATQAALTEIYNDGGNRLIPDRRAKAKETAGAEDGSEFTVWTKNLLLDGSTTATSENIASYTISFAKYVASDGKVVVFRDDTWTLFDSEAEAKSGDSPALDPEGNVSGSTSDNVIYVWGETAFGTKTGRELAGIDNAYLPGRDLDGKTNWREQEEVRLSVVGHRIYMSGGVLGPNLVAFARLVLSESGIDDVDAIHHPVMVVVILGGIVHPSFCFQGIYYLREQTGNVDVMVAAALLAVLAHCLRKRDFSQYIELRVKLSLALDVPVFANRTGMVVIFFVGICHAVEVQVVQQAVGVLNRAEIISQLHVGKLHQHQG